MTSFIYQPERRLDEQQLNVVSSMNRERQDDNVETAKKSAKRSLVLHQSSSKLKRRVKETNRDKGLTYSSKVLDFEGYEDEEYGGRKDRSLKIDCSEPADIVADIQNLNYQYIPKKKAKNLTQQQNAQEQKTRKANKEQKIDSLVGQKYIGEIVKDVESSEKLQQSWDLQEKRQKKIDLICFLILFAILVSLTSHRTRQVIFEAYSAVRN